MDWLDRAKGLGIVLVVFGHSLKGTGAAGLLPPDRYFEILDLLIYNFHMPLFFLLAGYTFERSARNKSPIHNLRSRAVLLLWPLLLWTYVFALFRLVAGAAANRDGNLADLMVLPLPPREHLWFLWALFVIQVLILPVALAGRAPRPAWVWLVLALVATVLVSVPGLPVSPLTVDAAVHLGTFLFGVWLARCGPLPGGRTMALLALAGFVAVEWISLYLPPDNILVVQVLGIVLSFCFILLMNAPRGAGAGGWHLLVWLGQLALPIYLAHTIFSAATRIVLVRVTEDPFVHLGLATLAGLVGPILLFYLLRRTGLLRLTGYQGLPGRRVMTPPAAIPSEVR